MSLREERRDRLEGAGVGVGVAEAAHRLEDDRKQATDYLARARQLPNHFLI